MPLLKKLHLLPLLAMAGLLSSFATAQAQSSIFFDWGSNEKVNDSGREIVSFNSPARKGELIVSFGDRRIYYIIDNGKAISYPIAVPREKSKWEGVTSVSQKRVNPSWTPTPDMIAENPRLPPWVPGGHPMNPLGTHALYLGSSSYRIHGTDAPWTIGTAASKGCVRMYNKDVQDLYPRIPIGTKVTVTYKTYQNSPLDSSSSQEIIATLDKGKKSKGSTSVSEGDDDVAEQAAERAKKWRDGEDASPVAVRASKEDEVTEDNSGSRASNKSDADTVVENDDDGSSKAKKSGSRDDSDEGRDAKSSAKLAKAIADDEARNLGETEKPRKKRSSSVETGSIKHDDTERDPVTGWPIKAASKSSSEKHSEKSKPSEAAEAPKKAAKEDPSVVAERALAAAERAAAAAERAAEAAERASAAATRASSKSEQAAKAESPAAMDGWPVVKGGATP